MGQRDWLGSVLLKAGRTADALSFAQAWIYLPKDDNWPPRGGCAFEPLDQLGRGLISLREGPSMASDIPCHTLSRSSPEPYGGPCSLR